MACAVVFGVLNACLVGVAAWLVAPEARLADMLWDRERMLLDLTETCVGILVTVACALSALLLAVALPPVVLLQRSLLHSQLKAQARTDAKTGTLNAGAWQEESDLAVDRARRRDQPLAVLLADIDHFKEVNDTHGHLAGDAVLRTLAAEMRQQVRESDLVGRFGGEERRHGQGAQQGLRRQRHRLHRRRRARQPRLRPRRADRRGGQGALPGQARRPRPGLPVRPCAGRRAARSAGLLAPRMLTGGIRAALFRVGTVVRPVALREDSAAAVDRQS